jgi:hypothetical protein
MAWQWAIVTEPPAAVQSYGRRQLKIEPFMNFLAICSESAAESRSGCSVIPLALAALQKQRESSKAADGRRFAA